MSITTELLAGVGVALVAGAWCWRALATRRTRRAITRLVEDPDPSARAAALEVVAGQGLAPFAPLLVERSRVEDDPGVRDALAGIVARNQWEPVRTPAMVDLRLWAHRNLAADRAAIAQPASGEAALRSSQVAAGGTGQVPSASSPPGPRSPSTPLPLVVVGVGGPAGSAVVAALKELGHRVIAADADPFAEGLRLVDEILITPPIGHPDTVGMLARLVEETGAAGLACADGASLSILSVTGGPLSDLGIATWWPDAHAAALARDRATTARVLAAVGVPSDFGAASRLEVDGVAGATADGSSATGSLTHRGRSFGVEALVTRTGVLAGSVSYWRPAGRGGEAATGATFHHPSIPNLVSAALAAVGLRGPATLRGLVEDDGSILLTAVAPGFSAGLPLALAAGSDLVGQYLCGLLSWPVRTDRLVYHDGVSLLRSGDGEDPGHPDPAGLDVPHPARGGLPGRRDDAGQR